ncbi:GNAT family N-acetyltransferase [Leptolyngbya sp. FACHB-671]|uniref:GNAT family N-acetyltransferase n=1 Tax=Leptolyngbya sp. FACHB-671 TaxID=2692812 RepID=UPI00168A0537|nr:GNAT family N-acetyltransferase [Leptolyngbya sp. FACHB-671]MBD1869859.1 GNAT family N-acetyltransferase [Cyanobacteria bacterium FACHB-471]MBD2068065.1 GNAT family N-acetyltransferase [Leptolyngbya sp. FACHB-671]
MKVFQAHFEHLEEVTKLFDQYRVFYQSSSDLEAAREFLQERFHKQDSIIFVVQDEGRIVGFTQLYPSFSSVSMKRVWILNDLFVELAWRNKGVAKLLLRAAEDFARETEAVRITLATQISNTAAQALYESLGYCQDEAFYHYSLPLVAA